MSCQPFGRGSMWSRGLWRGRRRRCRRGRRSRWGTRSTAGRRRARTEGGLENVKMYSLEADVKAILTNYKIRHDLIKRKSHDIFHSTLSITCIYYVKNLHIISTVRTRSSIYFPGSHQFNQGASIKYVCTIFGILDPPPPSSAFPVLFVRKIGRFFSRAQ